MYGLMDACMDGWMNVCMHVCTYNIYIYNMYTYVYIHTYQYIHIQLLDGWPVNQSERANLGS